MDLKALININILGFLSVGIVGFTLVFADTTFPSISDCTNDTWSCNDGSCIDAELKCNGALDCPDGSDEAYLLCRAIKCHGFKCAYGGCVAHNATCDGVRDCADGSDELLFRCRNETTYIECLENIDIHKPKVVRLQQIADCQLARRTCKNGEILENFSKCDGKVDCEDGSDETLETCAADERSCYDYVYGPNYRCEYGGCVAESTVCNGVIDCLDGSDELDEICGDYNNDSSKWECDDGTSIDAKSKCNGALDCPDGSDETFIHCNENKCPYKFRCVYGACVSNNATCDGVRDCADNSDELLTKCRNEMTFTECQAKAQYLSTFKNSTSGFDKFHYCLEQDETCDNGQILKKNNFKCDGRVHCEDGSDETLETCATDRHNCIKFNMFRCQYGACIDRSKVCNEEEDCPDGSDEIYELCHITKCVLPEYPEYGNYTVIDEPLAQPGMALKAVLLVYSCDPGYKHNGKSQYVICSKGSWAEEPLKCVAQCTLKKDPSTEYLCRTPAGDVECEEEVAEGTTVVPKCREPDYYYPEGVLPYVTCVDGDWDRSVPTCVPYDLLNSALDDN